MSSSVRLEISKLDSTQTTFSSHLLTRVIFGKKFAPARATVAIGGKPAGYLKLKRWGMETWPSLTMPSLEADDVLGIICTQGDSNFVLVSPDKDMLQIPCRHWNLKEEFTVEPEDAERALYLQALTGDSTDGYPGLAGCGPKKAAAILDKAKEGYWSAVVAAYEKSGFTEEDALKQLRLAKILQSSDWDEEKQEPILFTP